MSANKSIEELGLLWESIFDGYDSDKKEDKKDDKESSDKPDFGKKDDSSDTDSDETDSSNDSDKETDDSDDSDDSKESEGSDSSNKEKSGNRSIQGKVKTLQKQYNDLIIAAVEMHAADCVDQALGEVDGALGENIHQVIDTALNYLKSKVLNELGVECCDGSEDGDGDNLNVEEEPLPGLEDDGQTADNSGEPQELELNNQETNEVNDNE